MPRKPLPSETAKESFSSATSYDVALLAGVSQSAVSRCFKPNASISEKTRKKVLAAAEQLHYAPNAIARSLITRRSNIVAVLITETTSRVTPEILFELNVALLRRSLHLLRSRSTVLDFVVIVAVIVVAKTVSLIAASGVGAEALRWPTLRLGRGSLP